MHGAVSIFLFWHNVAEHAVAVLIALAALQFAASMTLRKLWPTAVMGQLVRLEQGQTHVLAIPRIEISRTVRVHKRMHAAAARRG